MIDTTAETVLTLAEAAKRLPRRRRGRKIHVSTIYRWTVSGCRGIVLDHIQIGGTRCTSLTALQSFFDRLTRASEIGGATSHSRSLVQRQRQSKAAEKELERLGV